MLNRGMGTVLGSLAQIGYDTEWHCIRAGTVGLPQIRNRVWMLAYSNEIRRETPIIKTKFTNKAGSFREWEQVELCGTRSGNARWIPSSRVVRVGDGLPSEMDISRFECCGNAVVPQIPEIIGYAILEAMND